MTHKPVTSTTPDWVQDVLRDCPPIMTVEQVVKLTQLSYRTIHRAVAAGQIQVMKSALEGSGRCRFARVEVGKFLQAMVAA